MTGADKLEAKPAEITKEEHLDYLESSSKLMLWFAREWGKTHPEEDFESIVRNRTDLWRKTSFYAGELDGPMTGYSEAWLEILHRISKAHEETKDDSNSARFEEICVELLKPHWAGRVDRDIMDHPNVIQKAGYQCGSLRYDLVPYKDPSIDDSGSLWAKNSAAEHDCRRNCCYPVESIENNEYKC